MDGAHQTNLSNLFEEAALLFQSQAVGCQSQRMSLRQLRFKLLHLGKVGVIQIRAVIGKG